MRPISGRFATLDREVNEAAFLKKKRKWDKRDGKKEGPCDDELREIGFHVYGIGKPPPRIAKEAAEASDAAAKAAEDTAKAARIKVGAARPEDVHLDGTGSALGGASRQPPELTPSAPKAIERTETLGGMA